MMKPTVSSTAKPERSRYSGAGVSTSAEEMGLKALLHWVNKTHCFRKGLGEARIDIGYFASVIDIGHGLGLAITTDGVGSKLIVAQMVGRYDTVGIDCVAMNVNDLLCTGAEPLALVDCISLEEPSVELLGQIGKGLYEGAREAGINIVGGEIAQVRDMVKGFRPGFGFDLVGTCVGIVPLDEMNVGASVAKGDIVVGIRSSGIHSNGLTLARKVLIESGAYKVDDVVPELNRTLGDELLEPTRIYVREVVALRDSGIRVKALANITSDGLLNLARVQSEVGYVLNQIPQPHAIFDLIQRAGNIDDTEMFHVYNMGIGFCVVVDPADADRTLKTIGECGADAYRLGYAVSDPKRRVRIEPYKLLGRNDRFVRLPSGRRNGHSS